MKEREKNEKWLKWNFGGGRPGICWHWPNGEGHVAPGVCLHAPTTLPASLSASLCHRPGAVSHPLPTTAGGWGGRKRKKNGNRYHLSSSFGPSRSRTPRFSTCFLTGRKKKSKRLDERRRRQPLLPLGSHPSLLAGGKSAPCYPPISPPPPPHPSWLWLRAAF